MGRISRLSKQKMIKALLIDLARTLLFPVDKTYAGGINDLYVKIKGTADFKFFDNFKLNRGLMDYLESIKSKMPLYVFTSEWIQNDPAVKDMLDQLFIKVYSAEEMGISKKDPEAYKLIARDIKLDPEEILFIDDSAGNVEAAEDAGMPAIQFKDNKIIDLIGERIKP